jgi:threonylcarbamoyladenosine tRNA methylthiotransferase MtaB
MHSEPTFHIQTLGCRVNQYDEEIMRRDFLRRGFREVAFEAAADVYVINTCTVTHVADRKSRQLIRRALRSHPESRVIATGCAVGNKHALARLPARVIMVSNQHKERLVEVVRAELPPHHERDEQAADTRQRHARALLKVQDGCNQFCTFCIVPFVRGRARSKPPLEVLREARALVAEGYAELVITGVHVGSYGRDLHLDEPWSLGSLLRLLSRQSGAARLRLSSVEPADFPLDLLDTMAESDTMCRHLHLALQHASDRVLERMRRGYDLAHYDSIVRQYLRRFPHGALGADILVGFPGETEQDFDALLAYVESTPFAHLHVFPYSARPGTAASKYPDAIPESVIAERMQRLLVVAERQARAFRERGVGQTVKVLVERVDHGEACGTSDNYLNVRFLSQRAVRGDLVKVRISDVEDGACLGKEDFAAR